MVSEKQEFRSNFASFKEKKAINKTYFHTTINSSNWDSIGFHQPWNLTMTDLAWHSAHKHGYNTVSPYRYLVAWMSRYSNPVPERLKLMDEPCWHYSSHVDCMSWDWMRVKLNLRYHISRTTHVRCIHRARIQTLWYCTFIWDCMT